MSSFSSLPGLKYGIFLAGTETLTPVFGLRPMRAPLSRSRNDPNPRSSIFCPSFKDRTMASKTVSTIASACFLVTSVATATLSISSAFVIRTPRPPGRGDDRARPRSQPMECPRTCPLRLRLGLRAGVFRLLAGALLLRARLRCCALGGRGRARASRFDALSGQADLHLRVLDPEDAGAKGFPLLVVVLRLLSARQVRLGDVHQPLDEPFDLDEDAEVRHARDDPFDDVPRVKTVFEGLPVVRLEFLDRKRDSPVLLVDRRDDGLDVVALLEHLRRMLDALGPRHVGDVHETVHTLFDLDERAEVGQVPDLPVDAASDGVLLDDALPRVGKCVLERERDAARVPVHVGDDRLDGVPRGNDLRGILHLLGPGHLRDVDEALAPLLELHERSVVRDVRDAARHARARRIALGRVAPRMLGALLGSERDALRLPVELEHDHVDLVADLDEAGGAV